MNAATTNSKLLAVLAAVLGLTAPIAGADAGQVALKDTAQVSGDTVTLGDIAELEGEYAKEIAGLQVAKLGRTEKHRTLTLLEVHKALRDQDVHWGRLVLRGASRIKLERVNAKLQSEDSGQRRKQTVQSRLPYRNRSRTTGSGNPQTVANPRRSVATGNQQPAGALTVRQRILRMIQEEVGVEANNLRVSFRDSDAAILRATVRDARFELKPLSSRLVGRVPILVRRYEGQQVTDKKRLVADVAVRRQALIALRTLRRGQTIVERDVEVQPVWFDSTVKQIIQKPQRAIGQRAASLLREGDVVHVDEIRSPLVIERGQMVTVRCISGGLVVKTVARAMEDAQRGQTIEVRNERTRESFRVRATGPQQAVLKVERAHKQQVAVKQEGGP